MLGSGPIRPGCMAAIMFLYGCATNPDVAMKIEQTPEDFRILMGEFDGSLALIHGSPKHARIHVTDGSFSCDGVSNSGKFRTDMRTNHVTHLFHFTCDDGSTGQLLLKITMRGDGEAYGAGVGNLNNGAQIKVVVGDMTGMLSW